MRKFRKLGKTFPAFALLVTGLWIAVWVEAQAQDGGPNKDVVLGKEAFITPPKVIMDAVLAAQPEGNVTYTNISPDGKKFLVTKNDGMPTLDRMGRPCVHLGEMAFDHTAHRSHGLFVRSNPGYELYYYAEKRTVPVKTPPESRVSNPAWSPDGSQLAFYVHTADATHIYIADTTTGQSRKLTKTPVLATLVTTFHWSRDGKRIQTVLLPDDGSRVIKRSDVATEPKVRVALDGKNPSRTYRYLLETPYDMQLLEHLATGQLAFINVSDGKVTKVGAPDMLRTVSMCPGGDQFRVGTMKKPFSYYVPASNFGTQEGIWNVQGKNLATLSEKSLQADQPPPAVVADPTAGKGKGQAFGKKGKGDQTPGDPNIPLFGGKGADPNAKRDIGWRPDGVGMSFLQLAPAKDKDDKKPRGDRVMQWLPPYGKDDVKVVYETPHRITTLQYSEDCQWLFLTQTVDNQRQIVAVDLKDPKTIYDIQKSGTTDPDPVLDNPFTPPADELRSDDGYDSYEFQKKGPGGPGGAANAPGLLTRSNIGEVKVVRISREGDVYLAGTDRSGGAANPRPYIDKVNIKTGAKSRIFAGKSDMLETIDAVDGDDVKIVFTTRQKREVVPDSFLTDLKTGHSEKLTNNENHNQWFHNLKVETITITRVDGFKFKCKITTAPDAKGKLPAMFWIYPREYTDQASYNGKGPADGAPKAGPDAGGRYTAPGARSMSMLTLLGYAVIEPDVPIVGPAGRMNDNYVHDLRNSLWAVIDELDRRGIIDRDRLACGGHSYGAFSTANAMVHTPFFKAGIAGDGCYNRTLTPMSFQTEKRQIWEARETYLEMSPLLWAERMNGALLMYHGMEDANVGTNPINAEYLYMCLRGLGKPVSLYMYPYEGHGPIARETTLDQWARWTAWLDTYVMNPKQQAK